MVRVYSFSILKNLSGIKDSSRSVALLAPIGVSGVLRSIAMLIDPFRCLGGDLDSVDSTPKYIADEDMGARGLKRDAIGATHDLRRALQISRIRKFTERPPRSIGANKAEAVDLVSHNQSAVRQHHAVFRPRQRTVGRKDHFRIEGHTPQGGKPEVCRKPKATTDTGTRRLAPWRGDFTAPEEAFFRWLPSEGSGTLTEVIS
jgi:hypothetical protein